MKILFIDKNPNLIVRIFLLDFKYWIKDNELILNVLLASGSREHLSADLLVDYIKKRTSNVNEDAFVEIKREEMYFTRNEKPCFAFSNHSFFLRTLL